MKNFDIPEIRVQEIIVEDVITTSPNHDDMTDLG